MIDIKDIKCYVGKDGVFKGFNFNGVITDLDTIYESYDEFVKEQFDEDEGVDEADFAFVRDKYLWDVGDSNDTLHFTINGDEITIFYAKYNSMMNDFDIRTIVFNCVNKTFREMEQIEMDKKHVYIFSSYWLNWSEIIGYEDGCVLLKDATPILNHELNTKVRRLDYFTLDTALMSTEIIDRREYMLYNDFLDAVNVTGRKAYRYARYVLGIPDEKFIKHPGTETVMSRGIAF